MRKVTIGYIDLDAQLHERDTPVVDYIQGLIASDPLLATERGSHPDPDRLENVLLIKRLVDPDEAVTLERDPEKFEVMLGSGNSVYVDADSKSEAKEIVAGWLIETTPHGELTASIKHAVPPREGVDDPSEVYE